MQKGLLRREGFEVGPGITYVPMARGSVYLVAVIVLYLLRNSVAVYWGFGCLHQ